MPGRVVSPLREGLNPARRLLYSRVKRKADNSSVGGTVAGRGQNGAPDLSPSGRRPTRKANL
jgi:hypothetical protein